MNRRANSDNIRKPRSLGGSISPGAFRFWIADHLLAHAGFGAQNGHGSRIVERLLSGEERTCRTVLVKVQIRKWKPETAVPLGSLCLDFVCEQLRFLRTNDLAQSGVWLCGTPLKYLSNLGWCFPANFITTAFKFCERSTF